MPIERQVHLNDLDIAVYEWGDPQVVLPAILFAHATGFHARLWDQVIARLPDYEVIQTF